MKDPLSFRYPGRFIAVGSSASGEAAVVVYGATGRSPSSLARRFVRDGDGIYMGGIDDTVGSGNRELLEYPAVRLFPNGVLVANGRHIERIDRLESRDARKQLSYALSEEAYEPDEYRTPRITGCVVESGGTPDAALHIVRSAPDGIDRSSWSVSLEPGKGMYVGTYAGGDVKPTPSFSGGPLSIEFPFKNAREAAEGFFASYAPKAGEADYRVGVVAVFKIFGGGSEVAIVNRL